MTFDLDPALRAALRGALALLWLAAASHKLRAPARFRDALAGYQLVPATAVQAVAALVAALELAIALALLAPGTGAADSTRLAAGATDVEAGAAAATSGAL